MCACVQLVMPLNKLESAVRKYVAAVTGDTRWLNPLYKPPRQVMEYFNKLTEEHQQRQSPRDVVDSA